MHVILTQTTPYGPETHDVLVNINDIVLCSVISSSGHKTVDTIVVLRNGMTLEVDQSPAMIQSMILAARDKQ